MPPLLIELEFARAERADDPHAFRFVPQEYHLRREGGRYETARYDWTHELEADLQAVRLPGRDPEISQRLGECLRWFLQPTDWSAQEQQCVEALRDERGVILTIRSAAAEIY